MRFRLLILRPDKLGDVLMSLPAVEAVRRAFPEAQISLRLDPLAYEAVRPFLQARGVEPVLGPLPGQDWDGLLSLVDIPGALPSGFRRIPVRVGVWTRLLSGLRLNYPVRQRRSEARCSESEYCLQLARVFVERLRGQWSGVGAGLEISQDAEEAAAADKALESLGNKPFLLVHPGMSGSALNLTCSGYEKLLRGLVGTQSLALVFGEGPADADRQMVSELVQRFPSSFVVRGLALGVYREVLRRARLVVAPSTGPLHLAHWVGTPTLGLFSPVQSQRALRWAPAGGTGQSWVFTPLASCGATRTCLGTRCRDYFCLDGRGLDTALVHELKGLQGILSRV